MTDNFFDPYNPPPPKAKATLWEYLKSKEFLVTIGSLIGGGFLLLVGFFYIVLPLLTHHNETVDVPDVTSIHLKGKYILYKTAVKKLEEVGLHPVVNDSQYYPEMPPLAVIRQEPVGLTLVKPGRTVYLVVNKTSPPMVKLPDLIEVNLEQAKSLLANWKLKVGRISYRPDNHSNLVLETYFRGQRVERLTAVPEGAPIDLVISSGTAAVRTVLPNVVGMELQEALTELNFRNLIAQVNYKNDGGAVNTVLSQSPRPGPVDSVYMNTTVLLTVSGSVPGVIPEGSPAEETQPDKANDDDDAEPSAPQNSKPKVVKKNNP